MYQSPTDQKCKKFELKQAVKLRFRHYIENIIRDHALTELILVVDQATLKLLSNLFKITEIVAFGITLVQRLELKRKILDDMHALYFIEPREQPIKMVIQDFKQRRQYKKLHLLFTYSISKSNLKLLSLESNLIKYLAKHSIKEFFHSMYFIEGNTFTLQQEYLRYAYSEYDSDRQERVRNRVAIRFVDIFCSLGEFYQVNIYYNKSANAVSKKLATLLKAKIEQNIGMLHKNKSNVINPQAEDIEVIILDRSLDPITPLLHNLRYESMLFDLLQLQLEYYEQDEPEPNAQTTKTKKTEKSQTLDKNTDKSKEDSESEAPKKKKKKKDANKTDNQQSNTSMQQLKQLPKRPKQLPKKQPMPKGLNQILGPVYQQYRHQHLPILMQKIPADVERHKQQIDNATVDTANDIDTTLTKQLSIHHMLVRQCYRIYKQRQLDVLIGLEQCLSTGIADDGKQTSSVDLLTRVKAMIAKSSFGGRNDKLRLGLLAMCCISLSQSDFKALRSEYPEQDQKALDNLLWLGVSVSSSTQRSTKNINEKSRAFALQKMQKTNMPLSRYTSVTGMIVPLIIDGLLKSITIDEGLFSLVVANLNEKKQLKKQQFKEEQRKKKRLAVVEQPKTRKKLIIFFVGGVSFSEISELRSIENLGYYDMIIGTDQLLTPQTYIEALDKMKEHV